MVRRALKIGQKMPDGNGVRPKDCPGTSSVTARSLRSGLTPCLGLLLAGRLGTGPHAIPLGMGVVHVGIQGVLVQNQGLPYR